MYITLKKLKAARRQLEEIITELPGWYEAWAKAVSEDGLPVSPDAYQTLVDSLMAINTAYAPNEIFVVEDALTILSTFDLLYRSELDRNHAYTNDCFAYSLYSELHELAFNIVDEYWEDLIDLLSPFKYDAPIKGALYVVNCYRKVCRDGRLAGRWASDCIEWILKGLSKDETLDAGDYEELQPRLRELSGLMCLGWIDTKMDLRYISDMDITVGFISLEDNQWPAAEGARTPGYDIVKWTVSSGWTHGQYCEPLPEGGQFINMPELLSSPCLFNAEGTLV